MKLSRCMSSCLVALACIGVAFPQLAVAANPSGSAPAAQIKVQTRDAVLGKDGMLRGQVVNQQGVALAATPIALTQNGQIVAAVQTDAKGNFELAQVRGGMYQLHTAGGVGSYRVWANGTAPPSANQQVLFVHDEAVALGQLGGGLMGFLANPWVIGAVVATAVAVPVVVHNSDNGSSS